MKLKGFYNEGDLINLLIDGDITKVQYFLHHSKYKKEEYLSFCKEKGLNPKEKESGELFWKEDGIEEDKTY